MATLVIRIALICAWVCAMYKVLSDMSRSAVKMDAEEACESSKRAENCTKGRERWYADAVTCNHP